MEIDTVRVFVLIRAAFPLPLSVSVYGWFALSLFFFPVQLIDLHIVLGLYA